MKLTIKKTTIRGSTFWNAGRLWVARLKYPTYTQGFTRQGFFRGHWGVWIAGRDEMTPGTDVDYELGTAEMGLGELRSTYRLEKVL